jgi:hypothetical protein
MVDRAMVSTMTMPVAGRQAADEDQQREPLLPLRHRQRQHEGVGVDPCPEVQQAAEGDRQDEDIDQQQVERKQPCRALQVRLVDVLDDRDLELARQEENRQPDSTISENQPL